MAPERCVECSAEAAEIGYGPESDLWSLGVVMYELATLRPPFSLI
jgi:serine/threonine protein kinase